MKKLFVAFATFQNGSNVLPIIFNANKGDQVLWLESETCKKLNIVDNSMKVLAKHGIELFKNEDIKDVNVAEPNYIISTLTKILEENVIKSYESVYLLFAGGQKPTSVAIFYIGALLKKKYPDALIFSTYLNYKPIELINYSFDENLFKSIPIPQGKRIKISEIAALFGLESSIKKNRFSEQAMNWQSFINDINLINDWHLIQSIPQANKNKKEASHYRDISRYSQNFIKDFKEEIADYIQQLSSYKKLSKTSTRAWMDFSNKMINIDSEIYQKFYDICKKNSEVGFKNQFSVQINKNSVNQFIKWGWLNKKTSNNVFRKNIGVSYGELFENMVLLRFQKYLDDKPAVNKQISDIKLNLILDKNQNGKKDLIAEHDIFLLLNNGVALSLECKTFGFETKDALARLMRLSQSTGQISKMVLVMPFFPAMEPLLFNYFMDLYKKVKELGFHIIKFGPEKVDKTFVFKDVEYQNETFEDGLDTLFDGYIK